MAQAADERRARCQTAELRRSCLVRRPIIIPKPAEMRARNYPAAGENPPGSLVRAMACWRKRRQRDLGPSRRRSLRRGATGPIPSSLAPRRARALWLHASQPLGAGMGSRRRPPYSCFRIASPCRSVGHREAPLCTSSSPVAGRVSERQAARPRDVVDLEQRHGSPPLGVPGRCAHLFVLSDGPSGCSTGSRTSAAPPDNCPALRERSPTSCETDPGTGPHPLDHASVEPRTAHGSLGARLSLVAHPVGRVLADHDASEVDVRSRDGRHDRRIDDAQVPDCAHPTVLVGHRHRVVGWSHACLPQG